MQFYENHIMIEWGVSQINARALLVLLHFDVNFFRAIFGATTFDFMFT